MKQIVLVATLCVLVASVNGNNPSYSGISCGIGIRTLSVQSLNEALKNEGLAELSPVAVSINFAPTFWNEHFVFNYKIHYFSSSTKKDTDMTMFSGWGASMDFGFPILKKDKMSLFPYFSLSYMMPRLKTQQTTNANSFGTVYSQPLKERTFYNNGELDTALGLAYRVVLGKRKSYMLEVGGGYNFSLLRSKWRYIENKIDFPKIDCRGWVIGITWAGNIRQKSTNSN